MKTHFKKREKCPKGFTMIGRSYPSVKDGRGGVAVYAKSNLNMKFHTSNDICPDAVIFEIDNTKAIFIAPFTPISSIYKEKEIFDNLDFIVKNFKHRYIYLLGDLNSRCATPVPTQNYRYKNNPDKVVNPYGRKLIKLCTDNNLLFINGLICPIRKFDSDFTFFRGTLKSQNDWCISNNVTNIIVSYPSKIKYI